MGGDGGVIAANRKFLRQCGDLFLNDEQKEVVNQREQKQMRTKVCAVSNEKLQQPIVVCELGYLYNKDAVLSALLERTLNPTFAHLRGLKDLITPKFTPNRAYKEAATSSNTGGDGDENSAPYMCPVTMLEFTGRYPFCALRSTGWVLAERAIAEVGMEGLQAEYGPFVADDVIRLAPDEPELAALKQRLQARREQAAAEKALKKASKASSKGEKRKATTSTTTSTGDEVLQLQESSVAVAADGDAAAAVKKHKDKKHKKDKAPAAAAAAAAHSNSSHHSTAAASLAQQATAAVKRQQAADSVFGSLFGKEKLTAEQLFASGKASCPV